MTDEDGRELAATIIDGTSVVLDLLGDLLGAGNPGVKLGLEGAGAGLRVVAKVVRRVGSQGAKDALEELQARIAMGEGTITTGDIAKDDEEVAAAIAGMFDGEHPDDDHILDIDRTNPFADDEESP